MPNPRATGLRSCLPLVAQCAVLAIVVTTAELAPRPGLQVWYLPLLDPGRHTALNWALANGATLGGAGPLGGLILTSAPSGLGTRALREGALAIAIPAFLCQPPKAPSHG